MRNWIIGAAAVVAVAVAMPGVAAAQTGYVDVAYTNSNVDVFGLDADVDTWAAGGAVAFDANALGVQLDGRFGNAEPDGGGDIDFWSLGGHIYKRQNNWLLGGFVGFGNFDAGGGADADEWTVALEGQYYMAQTTLNGAVSYSEADDLNFETTAVDVGLTHFINDNFSIDGNVGFANLETGGPDVDITTIGIGAEYQLSMAPVSIFGGYQHAEIDDINLDVDSFSIGIRYNWGGTLFDRNRSGAGLPRRGGLVSRLIG